MKNNMYKIKSVISDVVWAEFLHLFTIIAAVVRDEEGNLDAEYLQRAHWAFNTIIKMANDRKATPIPVQFDRVVVNTANQSILSNVMWIELGRRLATPNMISVSHKLFRTILAELPWQVADLNQANANRRIELLQKLMMERLVGAGIEIIDAVGGKTRYGFITATPAQQKEGGMYMGKASILASEPVQKALNFGRLFKDFNEEVPTNAVEWLKNNALLATPATPTEYSIRRIIIMKAVKVKRLFKNVCRVNADGTMTHLDEAELEQELFDGQMLTLITGQIRGWCIKGFGVGLYAELIDPDAVVIDIDGNERRIGDNIAICTDSCWKAKKFFSSYAEFCDKAEEIAEYIPDFDKIWVVRQPEDIDEDGEEVDYGRRLSRQTTQQWVHATTAELLHLTRKSRESLNAMKTYSGLYHMFSEESRPLSKQSDFAGLVQALPEIILTDAVQDFAKARYLRKQLDAAANKLQIAGNYPYICMDPVAMKQILVDGRNPMDEDLGVLKAGEVFNQKYKNGRKLFAVRYPANYQTAVVLVNKIVDVFKKLGDVAVLPMYGDTIIREDGDFDGDEMMFSPDKLVIKLTEQMIEEFHPELIDFPHGRKIDMVPWGNRDARVQDIANALWRAMRYNEVGIYSNMAVRCMHLGKIEECKMMHVMAILCLDMVKGTEVDPRLIATAEDIRDRINRFYRGAMPHNQRYRDQRKHITGRKYLAPSNDTPDTISRMIMTTNDYEFDAEGHELMDLWKLMQDGSGTSTRKGVMPDDMAQAFAESYSRSDITPEDIKIYRAIQNHEPVGVADVLRAAFMNECCMAYTFAGDNLNDKKAAYRELVREVCFSIGHGRGLSDEELHNHVVNWAADVFVHCAASMENDKKKEYAMFVCRVFAVDFLRNIEANRGILPCDGFEARREAAQNNEDYEDSVVEESACDLDID